MSRLCVEEEEDDRKPPVKVVTWLGFGGSTHVALTAQDTVALANPIPSRFVTLKVVDQEQRLVRRTIRMNGRLQAVMDAYYDEAPDVARGTGSFWFESVRLRGERTPADLKLEDGDVIDFFQVLVGGCGMVAAGSVPARIDG